MRPLGDDNDLFAGEATPTPQPERAIAGLDTLVPVAPRIAEALPTAPADWAATPPPAERRQPARLVPELPSGALRISERIYGPAGFGWRLRAFLVDFLILTVLGSALVAAIDLPAPDPLRELEVSLKIMQQALAGRLPSGTLAEELADMQRPAQFAGWLNVAMCAAYFILFHGLAAATPGKALCGLRVLRRDGRPMGVGPAALRYLVYFLTAKLAYGSFVMPLDAERRALHDMASGTNVFRELRWR